MTEPVRIEVRPLAPPLLDDYLGFFDARAFPDNPRWAGCYCYFPLHDPRETDWKSRTAAQNRAAVSERILDGRAHGYLAYAGGEVVGWCSAAPQPLYPILREDPVPMAEGTGAITCFVIAPEWRRRGVAATLLAAACEGLRAQGMKFAQAIPRKEAKSAAENHYGPLAMYLAAGFKVVREDDEGHAYVRKALG